MFEIEAREYGKSKLHKEKLLKIKMQFYALGKSLNNHNRQKLVLKS
jgi:hypothetical protein